MQSDRDLLKQALEALEWCRGEDLAWVNEPEFFNEAITALRERLAQPEQYQRPQMRRATREEKIDKPGVYWVPVEQEPEHDYRTRYDRGCYKCGSHYCPADCPEPAHLVSQQQNTIANSEAIPEQISEPVAMRYDFDGYGYRYIDSGSGSNWQTRIKDAEPLYTTPPRREWTHLTWEEIDECFKITPDQYLSAHIYKRIFTKLKEKNNAD